MNTIAGTRCTVCGASGFEHHGFAGWLCPGCVECGCEAYEAAQGLEASNEDD